MKRSFAILWTLAIVCGIPVVVSLIVDHLASDDTTGAVSVLVGAAFGTFTLDIYQALRGD